jgi:hypothetical protein
VHLDPQPAQAIDGIGSEIGGECGGDAYRNTRVFLSVDQRQ